MEKVLFQKGGKYFWNLGWNNWILYFMFLCLCVATWLQKMETERDNVLASGIASLQREDRMTNF